MGKKDVTTMDNEKNIKEVIIKKPELAESDSVDKKVICISGSISTTKLK